MLKESTCCTDFQDKNKIFSGENSMVVKLSEIQFTPQPVVTKSYFVPLH